MKDMLFLEKDYQNIRPLNSRGGMGELYRARKRSLGVEVVIKKVKSKYKGKVDQKNEANILKNLKHQYLPRIYDVVTSQEGYVYTIMDYIPGINLSQYVKKNGPVSQKNAYKWACQLCEVVNYLHLQKPPIIHCDIKPSNIMITERGDICLIDFNTSLFFFNGVLAVGTTNGYAAPEQYVKPAQGQHYVRTMQRYKNIEGGGFGRVYDPTEVMTDITEVMTDAAGTIAERTEVMTEVTEVMPEYRSRIQASSDMTSTEVMENPSEPRHGSMRRNGSGGYFSQSVSFRSSSIAETERAGGFGRISMRTDIYAIGASLYFAVTGRIPEKSLNPVRDISVYRPKISVLFQNIIRRAMSKPQERRFSSAREMLRALRDIAELDLRYQKQRRLRIVCLAGCIALFLLSTLCTVYGYTVVREERVNYYLELISKGEMYADTGSYEECRTLLEEAADVMPSRAEAYASMAVQLYKIGQYEEALDVFQNAFDSGVLDEAELDSAAVSNIDYIRANCLSELEKYDESIRMYEKALEYPDADSACYRGLALTQARAGKIEEAKETLNDLERSGGESADSDLVSAEICAVSGENSEAVRLYRQVIGETDDRDVLRHCYVSAAGLYEEQGDWNAELALLEEAVNVLEGSSAVQVRELLAETYAVAANQNTGRAPEWNQKSKELFAEMIESGYGTVVTYMNLASVEQKLGEYENAERELLKASEDYPHDYRPDMRLAFLHADWQSAIDIGARDYTKVEDYYNQAAEKYQLALASGTQDADMEILRNLISQLKSSGWL